MNGLRGALAVVCSAGAMALVAAGCGDDESSGGTGGSGGGGGGDPQQELQLSSYLGETSADGTAAKEWAAGVEEATNGSVTIEFFFGAALLPATETLSGVAEQRAQLGIMSHGYHPSELPLSHVLNLPFRSENVPAQMQAMADLYESEPAFKEEWERNGVSPLWFNILSPPVLGCKEPVEGPDDLDGKKVRAAALVTNVMQAAGADVIALDAPEIYEGVERGLIDCWTALSVDIAVDLGLHEVTPYIYDFGYGNLGATEAIASLETLEGLSESQRAAFEEQSAAIIERFPEITAERVAAACDTLAEEGVTYAAWDDAAKAAFQERAGDAADTAFAEIAGDQADAFLSAYDEALEAAEAQFADYEPPLADCAR